MYSFPKPRGSIRCIDDFKHCTTEVAGDERLFILANTFYEVL